MYPVLSRLRLLQVSQGLLWPLAKSFVGRPTSMCDFSCSLALQFAHRTVFAEKSIGCTFGRKGCLDFRCAGAGVCPNKECLTSFVCFVLYTLTDTSLLISGGGGAIPAIKYKSSTLVSFRQPVINRHAWFRTGFSLFAWDDLAQTGAAYSAVE